MVPAAPEKRDGEELNPKPPPVDAGANAGDEVAPKSPGLLLGAELKEKPPAPKAGAEAGEVLKLKEGLGAAAGAVPNIPPPNEGVVEKSPPEAELAGA